MPFSAAVIAVARERDGYACRCCGLIDRSIDVDHIKPQSQGGNDTLDNAQCLCSVCNRTIKGNVYIAFDKPCPTSRRWAIPESAMRARRALQKQVNRERKANR